MHAQLGGRFGHVARGLFENLLNILSLELSLRASEVQRLRHPYVVGRFRRSGALFAGDYLVRQSVKLAEAASHGLPITSYATHSVGFEDYRALADEILQQESAIAAEGGSRSTAPAVTPDGVVFTIEAAGAAQVQLAGDFNDWTPDGSEMEPVGRLWKKLLKLAPGRYRYRYVIDGQWRTDPGNAAVEASPFGGNDSVLTLDEPQPAELVLPRSDHGAA